MDEVAAGSKKKVTPKYYGDSDGLNTGGITSTSVSTQDSLGRIWFTLIDGFAIYDPVKSGKNQVAPKAAEAAFASVLGEDKQQRGGGDFERAHLFSRGSARSRGERLELI